MFLCLYDIALSRRIKFLGVSNRWMAYLNFQIEHHMFPAMPQFRHPATSIRVRELFNKHGLTYDVRGYFSCLGETLQNLHDVGHFEHDKENEEFINGIHDEESKKEL